ncbi:hypothetical protein KAR48_18840 [bacterium]|nr:hypothetical protein [bacterium]
MQISKISIITMLITIFMSISLVQAQIRIVEPIVITGSDLSVFAGAPVESLYLLCIHQRGLGDDTYAD